MVKAGVYVLFRLAPAMSGTTTGLLISFIGGFTFFAASIMAIAQTDGKKVLAFSTISNLGLMVACAGVTGVDISEEMIKIAKRKFADARVEFFCADVEEADLPSDYDVCMVYNAFPHFPNPAKLIEVLASHLKMGGRLTVAHSMSRKQLDSNHSGPAAKVSNDQMYIVSGYRVR